jgi:glycosyltransferase involved in cell wall biosynthesis
MLAFGSRRSVRDDGCEEGRPVPAVTVGMPVHNGAATIGAALDSLLGQTFRDFCIVVCDNGSTDATGRVCEAYARADPRISYVRLQAHVDATSSFRHALFAANTPYFMWAAADDLWAPRFIEAHYTFLRQHPDYVASQSRVLFVSDGFPSRMALGTFALTGDARANAARFFARPADNSRFYGLFRTEALKAVYPTRDLYGYDWVVSAGTLKFGRHHEVDEILAIRDETDPAAYADAAARHLGGRLRGLFPVLPASWYAVRNRLVPFSLSLVAALVRTNLRLHVRFLMYRLRKRLQASTEADGSKPSRALARLANAVAAQGLRERLFVRRRAKPAGRGLPAAIEAPQFGWQRLQRPERPLISVVAVARDRLLDLLALTHRLAPACGRHSFELIVVDLGSTDATRLCLGGRSDLVYLACDGEAGFAAAANAAVGVSRGVHLIFVEPDVAPHVGAFSSLIDALSRAELAAPLCIGPQDPPSVDFCPWVLAMARATYDAAGGFGADCHTLEVAGADLAARLRKAGGRVIVEPAAVVSLDRAAEG